MSDFFKIADVSFSIKSVLENHTYERNVRFDHWTTTLVNLEDGESMEFDYHQGEAYGCREPEIKDVLYALLQDYYSFEGSSDAADLAYSYGYEYDTKEDIAKVDKIWDSLKKNHKNFSRVAGEVIEELEEYFQDY